VEKERLRARIVVEGFMLDADVFIHAGSRLTDMLSAREAYQFIPLSNVVAYALPSRQELFRTEFVSLNRQSIVMVIPLC
jgi:hypothetical protein